MTTIAPFHPAAASAVDCHAHVVPQSFLADLERSSSGGCAARRTDAGWVVDLPGVGEVKVPPPMVNEGRRLQWCEDQGLSSQVLSPWMDVQPTAIMPAAGARSLARRLNDHVAELVAADGHPGGALASVAAAHDPDRAAEDLVEAVREQGFAGLMLSTNPSDTYELTDPRYDALWAAAEELGVPVMLHPPTHGPSAQLTGSGPFGNIYGRLIDTTLVAARLVISGIFDRHPGLDLVLVHGGGFLPYQLTRLDGGHPLLPDAPELERGHPSAYLDAFWYDTVALAPEAVGFLVGLVGAKRVLLGTDYPFNLGGPRPVATVAEALAIDDRVAVMQGNAATLFERGAHD